MIFCFVVEYFNNLGFIIFGEVGWLGVGFVIFGEGGLLFLRFWGVISFGGLLFWEFLW